MSTPKPASKAVTDPKDWSAEEVKNWTDEDLLTALAHGPVEWEAARRLRSLSAKLERVDDWLRASAEIHPGAVLELTAMLYPKEPTT